MSEPRPAVTSPPYRVWKLLLGPALGLAVVLARPGDDDAIASMAGIAAWMAAWWVTEAVPIPVTAMLPLVLLPFAGLMKVADVAVNYGRSTIYLFLGGFLLALGLQTCGAHRRIALGVVHRVGSRPRRLVLGFMLASWALSMWITNTSTTMLMLPIVLSVLAATREQGARPQDMGRLSIAALLGVAYAANMGGLCTIVGTAPNLAFQRLFHQAFPGAPEVTFLKWMMLCVPLSTAFLMCGWVLLTRVLFALPDAELIADHGTIERMRRGLGPASRDEKLAGTVFGLTALLWMTGASLDVGALHISGWRELLGVEDTVNDAVVAVAMATVLFLIPSSQRPGERLLEWRYTTQVPWGLLLLFGGGFALASGFTSSGLSAWAGSRFEALSGTAPLLLVLAVCLLLTFLTELTSNTATTEMLLPILAAASVTLGIDPRALMLPATLSASCAFMMPVATPPTAIVFGSGLIPIRQMIRAGFWFNLLGVALVTGTFAALAGPVLGVDLGLLPDWATP